MSHLIDACELTAFALQMSNKTAARIVREFSTKMEIYIAWLKVMLAGGELAVFSTLMSIQE